MKTNRITSKSRKRATIVIVVLSILVFAWWVFAHQEQPELKKDFQFAQVSRGNFEILVSSTGTLAAVETVEIGTQVSGTIDKLMVDYPKTPKPQLYGNVKYSQKTCGLVSLEATIASTL